MARPVGLTPTISVPSSFQPKCSLQICRRGLKRTAFSRVTRSIAVVCAPLNSLQRRQESQRLFSSHQTPKGRDVPTPSPFRSRPRWTSSSHSDRAPAAGCVWRASRESFGASSRSRLIKFGECRDSFAAKAQQNSSASPAQHHQVSAFLQRCESLAFNFGQ